MLICPNCGNREPEGSRFCGNCSTSLAAAEPTLDQTESTEKCPNCGSREAEGSQFCGSCGASLVATKPERDHTESIEPITATEVLAPVRTEVAIEVKPATDWSELPPSTEPEPAPVVRETQPDQPHSRWWPIASVAALALLVAGGIVGALLGTGVIDGTSNKSDSEFVSEVNENVLDPLDRADQAAAAHVRITGLASDRTSDGGRIVRVAEEGSAYLRTLGGLTSQQERQVQVLLALVAGNRRYGHALADFTGDDQSELALYSAAAKGRSAVATAESTTSASLHLPNQGAFIALSSPSPPPPPTSSTTTATTPTSTAATAYVQQVDDLLRESHAVVLALNAFIPRAASSAISQGIAVTRAQSFANQRQQELTQAEALAAPPEFARAQGLLIRALQASVADDQAIVAWMVARRDGTRNAKAAFEHANELGAQATAIKRQFLRIYGPQRQSAIGQSPATLPNSF